MAGFCFRSRPPDRYRPMNDYSILTDECLDSLLAAKDPGIPAWATQIHRRLEASCRDQYVFRFGESLPALDQWLTDTGTDRAEDHLFARIVFCSDTDAPRAVPEGGVCAFSWQEALYRV